MHHSHRLLLLLPLLLAADWPRFRGPNGTGVANDSIPVEFGPDKNLKWKAELPGPGHGSPVVAGGKLFVQAVSADGKQRWLVALDAKSGKQLWQRALPGQPTKHHRKNSLASSTPAVGGERVVEVCWDGGSLWIASFFLNGEPDWQTDLGGFKSEHGAGASPMILDDRVYLNADQDGDAHLLAFNIKTGSTAWTVDRKAHRACYSTPYVREVDGRKEVVVTSTSAVTAYDPVKGKVNWEHVWDWSYTKSPLRTVGSTVEGNGIIVAVGGDGGGSSHLIAIKPNGTAKPELLWEKKNKGWPYVPTMLIRDQYLFTVADKGMAGCWELATGKQVWFERLGGGFSASPILIGDKVYACNEDGVCFVYTAGPKFEVLARNALGEPITATPAVADGKLYVRGAKTIYCFGNP